MANQSNQSGVYIATLRMAASEGAELKAAAHRAQCSLNTWCVETLLAAARRAAPAGAGPGGEEAAREPQ